jgi:hypothetical protein
MEYEICHRSRSYFTTDGQSVRITCCRAHSGICDMILLPVGRSCLEVAVLDLWGALSDERTGLQFAVQSLNGPSCAEPVTILYCLISDSPSLEGRVPVFMSPGNRVGQLYPRALGEICHRLVNIQKVLFNKFAKLRIV